MSHKIFQCHRATAAVCAICPHFSFLTQLSSPFSLTAKMSGRVFYPCCQALCYCAELALKSLADWVFILNAFEVCRWKFPCSLVYRFTLYWKIQSGIDWNITWLSNKSTEGKQEIVGPQLCQKEKKTWKAREKEIKIHESKGIKATCKKEKFRKRR